MNALYRRLGRRKRSTTPLQVESVVRTHVGRVREINEDRVLARPDTGLWAVADGMGGHSGGEEAAGTLIAHLARIPAPGAPRTIGDALETANSAILAEGGGKSGTTAVVLHARDGRAEVYWAGDSRAYLIRGDALHLLTHDHSVVQQMVDAGALTPEQALRHPRANVITNALGVGATVAIDRVTRDLMPRDRLLLCSDGLTRSLCERDVNSTDPLDALADRLLTNALQRDGSDNISFVIVAFR